MFSFGFGVGFFFLGGGGSRGIFILNFYSYTVVKILGWRKLAEWPTAESVPV